MEEVVLFLMTFILLFLIYQVLFILPNKKKSSKDKKELIEIRYLELRYGLDLKEVSYPQLLQICAIVSCFDISIVVTLVSFIDNFWLKILIGLLSIFIIILISYHIVYLFYKKKGMVKDGKHKRNRK